MDPKGYIKRKSGLKHSTTLSINEIEKSGDSSNNNVTNTFQLNIQRNIDNFKNCTFLEKPNEPDQKAPKKQKREPKKCPECGKFIKSNLALHRKRHVVKLLAIKKNICKHQGCSYGTNLKSSMKKHAETHSLSHVLAKAERKRLRKLGKREANKNGAAMNNKIDNLPKVCIQTQTDPIRFTQSPAKVSIQTQTDPVRFI